MQSRPNLLTLTLLMSQPGPSVPVMGNAVVSWPSSDPTHLLLQERFFYIFRKDKARVLPANTAKFIGEVNPAPASTALSFPYTAKPRGTTYEDGRRTSVRDWLTQRSYSACAGCAETEKGAWLGKEAKELQDRNKIVPFTLESRLMAALVIFIL